MDGGRLRHRPMWIAAGITMSRSHRVLGIDSKTLRKHFARELDTRPTKPTPQVAAEPLQDGDLRARCRGGLFLDEGPSRMEGDEPPGAHRPGWPALVPIESARALLKNVQLASSRGSG